MERATTEHLPGLILAQKLLDHIEPEVEAIPFPERLATALAQAEADLSRKQRVTAPIDYAPEPAPEPIGKLRSSRLRAIWESGFMQGLLKAHGSLPVPFRVGILLLQLALTCVVTYSVMSSLFSG